MRMIWPLTLETKATEYAKPVLCFICLVLMTFLKFVSGVTAPSQGFDFGA